MYKLWLLQRLTKNQDITQEYNLTALYLALKDNYSTSYHRT